MEIKVSAVIVNYNTKEILRDCLANLKRNSPSLEVVVVDNNSLDGSAKMVTQEFPEARLISFNKNKGLAAGNNAGLKKAKGEYVLFLGPDAFPESGAIEKIVAYMDKNPEVGICVGKVSLRDGKLDKDSHRGFPTPWVALTHFSGLEKLFPESKLFGGYFLGHKDLKKIHEVDLCTSHFMFCRKKVFAEVGGWDEDFFVYGEDVDLCWRVKKAGWKIIYLPEAKVLHYKGVSVGIRKETEDITQATRETKEAMIRETTQAMLKFYKKHYQGKIYNPLILLGIRILAFFRQAKVSLGLFT